MFKIRREPAEYESKSLRLPIEMIEKVQKLADANNISFNKVITQCVDYALDNLDDNKDEPNEKMTVQTLCTVWRSFDYETAGVCRSSAAPFIHYDCVVAFVCV